jgi:hypothetical protein
MATIAPTQDHHPQFPQPENPTVPIWRYMDFPKFMAWLIDSSLVLRRVNLLEDKREGYHGKGFYDWHYRAALEGLARQNVPPTQEERLEAERVAGEALENAENVRRATFVSCWSKNEYESEAMWRIYAGRGAAIALVLPYERLRDSLPKDDRLIRIGEVKYFDYNVLVVRQGNVFRAPMLKSTQFSYEKEVRILEFVSTIWSGDKVPEGIPSAKNPPSVRTIPWAVADHVERVVISPYAESWQAGMIRKVIKRLNPALEDRIRESEMA